MTSDPPAAFEGQVAIVTGASSGIGRAVATGLVRLGCSTVCAARSVPELEATVAELNTEGGGAAIAVPTDVADDESVRALISRAGESFGRLDLAFNNAGTPGHGTVTQTAVADLDRILGVNLRGVFLCLKYEVEAMQGTEGPKAIVNCSSAAGHRGVPNKSAYAASKWGVVGLTKSAALDYAERGIRINAVSPGGIATALLNEVQSDEARQVIASSTPMHRIATPEECADAVLWLLSEKSSYVTGTVINVDGGLSAGFAADAAGRR